jgi:predicted DNA-binding transcriptional regulator YafY
VCGVEEDMKHLQLQTTDSYRRYVQDTIKKYLGIDALTYIRIEPLYENRVVAIHVEPHPYRLVELSGVAYLRVNAESREMPEKVREEIIARKVFKDRNRAAAISLLQHACSERKCVILHKYSSSNSGTVKERKVEPYDVKPEDGLVFALDCNDIKSKVFSINRIGYVEILDKEGWKYTSSHEDIKVDVFHMSGTMPLHVSLQLDLMAKNLLVEEYPASRNIIKPHKGDDDIWYFDTDVYRMEGIGRFYIGLANHIKIIEGDELKRYVKDYIASIEI